MEQNPGVTNRFNGAGRIINFFWDKDYAGPGLAAVSGLLGYALCGRSDPDFFLNAAVTTVLATAVSWVALNRVGERTNKTVGKTLIFTPIIAALSFLFSAMSAEKNVQDTFDNGRAATVSSSTLEKAFDEKCKALPQGKSLLIVKGPYQLGGEIEVFKYDCLAKKFS